MNDDKNPSSDEPTEQFGRGGDSSGEGPAGAASAGRPGEAEEAAQQSGPGSPGEQTGQAAPSAEQAAQTSQQAGPAAQQPTQPGPFAQPGPWGMPLPPPKQSGFRRFVAHRATQLVAVGVLGLAVGGGIVGGVMAATHHHPGRPGMSQHQGGNGHRFDDGGPGQRHRVPDGQDGGNQNNGPGFGNGNGGGTGSGN
ncbi:hypothetical protein [Amycolatopsis sp. NPDC054798]